MRDRHPEGGISSLFVLYGHRLTSPPKPFRAVNAASLNPFAREFEICGFDYEFVEAGTRIEDSETDGDRVLRARRSC
jgi:hypothetical protein